MKTIISIILLTALLSGCGNYKSTNEIDNEEYITECPDATVCMSVETDSRPIEIREIDFSQGIIMPIDLDIGQSLRYIYLESENAVLSITFYNEGDTIRQVYYKVDFYNKEITYDDIIKNFKFGFSSADSYVDNYEILSAEYIGRLIVDDVLVDQYDLLIQFNFSGNVSFDPFRTDDDLVIKKFNLLPVVFAFTVDEPVELETEKVGEL